MSSMYITWMVYPADHDYYICDQTANYQEECTLHSGIVEVVGNECG